MGRTKEKPRAIHPSIHHWNRIGARHRRSRPHERETRALTTHISLKEPEENKMISLAEPLESTSLESTSMYEREELLNGCQAVAQAVRLADVDVIAADPIRPYTEVMDAISKIIADGELDAEYIIADSEHSQFEIVKHAASVNARAFAGSSGTGWMYGFEAL